jgi:exopolysaccharide biosynthesis polyprenyl glycosylphosphotransferase
MSYHLRLQRGDLEPPEAPARTGEELVIAERRTSLIGAGMTIADEVTRSSQGDVSAEAPGHRVVDLSRWVIPMVVADAMAAAVGALTLLTVRFGVALVPSTTGYYPALAVALVPAWLITLTLAGTYDTRFIAAGAEQYRRIVNGGAWLLAIMTFIAFALRADVSRGLVLGTVPVVALLTIVERYATRKFLQRRFAADWVAHRVVAIGSVHEIVDLVDHMSRASYSGFRVVAALTPGELVCPALPVGVSWAGGDVDDALRTTTDLCADTLALAGPHVLARGGLRRLSWELEGSNIDLVVAPALTDIAGPRIRIRPVEGLPLLHIDRPQFTGVRRVVKTSIDRVSAALLLIALSPLLVLAAITIKVSSKGPVLFRQTRVGLNGDHFQLLKLRTMVRTAESDRDQIDHLNEHDGILFKLRRDPRVTRLGRLLRRFSIDEVPQLWNVLKGDMSLVGPRPPLPSEVERYGFDVHRRLLVKPGLTGIWQISGRADLSWEETVRLDLHYVDHWSVGLDMVLLWKTLLAVIRGRGAY